MPSHYLNQCWPIILMHICITQPEWVNICLLLTVRSGLTQTSNRESVYANSLPTLIKLGLGVTCMYARCNGYDVFPSSTNPHISTGGCLLHWHTEYIMAGIPRLYQDTTGLHHNVLERVRLTHLPLDKMAATLADDNFKCIFLNENDRIPIWFWVKFVPVSPIYN